MFMKTRNVEGEGKGVPLTIIPVSGNEVRHSFADSAIMRQLLLLVLISTSAFAQLPSNGPDFSRAARPRGWFYLSGIGHQYVQGTNYTVIAAALPVLNAKFFGVKLHVINRGANSVNVLPQDFTADDSVSAKQLALYTSAEVSEKLLRPSGMARLAGFAAGGPSAGNESFPTITDLLREMVQEAAAENPWSQENGFPTLKPRGTGATHSSPVCDLGCELRNREIGDGNGPQLLRRPAKPEVIEQSEFLANTVPPGGDVSGVLYFAMPKMTDRAPISQNGHKSYRVTVTVPVGEEKFQFVFPPE
jgi:hypothetical protein